MLKIKKDKVVIFLLLIPLLIAGCSSQKASSSTQESSSGTDTQDVARGPVKIESDNLIEGTLDDLKVGGNILAVGDENADGSVVAIQIITGENPEDFNNLGGRAFRDNATSTRRRIATSSDEQRSDPAQFQNMSDEERAAMRENMQRDMGNRPDFSEEDRANFAQRRNTASGQTNSNSNRTQQAARVRNSRTVGEIISIVDGVITVKLESGGSKLIFYSDETVVNNIKKENIE